MFVQKKFGPKVAKANLSRAWIRLAWAELGKNQCPLNSHWNSNGGREIQGNINSQDPLEFQYPHGKSE